MKLRFELGEPAPGEEIFGGPGRRSASAAGEGDITGDEHTARRRRAASVDQRINIITKRGEDERLIPLMLGPTMTEVQVRDMNPRGKDCLVGHSS